MSESTTIAISSSKLKHLLHPVLPLAGRDDMLPVLNAVHVLSHGPHLLAEATDRFRCGINRIELAEAGATLPPFEALIPLDVVRAILRMFRPTTRQDADLELTSRTDDAGADWLDVTATGTLGMLFNTAQMTFPLLRNTSFPKIASLFQQALEAEPRTDGTAKFNWHFLAGFAAAQGGDQGLTMRYGPKGKAVIVTNGENFIGIIMPRLDPTNGAIDLASWSDYLGRETTEKKPKTGTKKATAKVPAKKTAGAKS